MTNNYKRQCALTLKCIPGRPAVGDASRRTPNVHVLWHLICVVNVGVRATIAPLNAASRNGEATCLAV